MLKVNVHFYHKQKLDLLFITSLAFFFDCWVLFLLYLLIVEPCKTCHVSFSSFLFTKQSTSIYSFTLFFFFLQNQPQTPNVMRMQWHRTIVEIFTSKLAWLVTLIGQNCFLLSPFFSYFLKPFLSTSYWFYDESYKFVTVL